MYRSVILLTDDNDARVTLHSNDMTFCHSDRVLQEAYGGLCFANIPEIQRSFVGCFLVLLRLTRSPPATWLL